MIYFGELDEWKYSKRIQVYNKDYKQLSGYDQSQSYIGVIEWTTNSNEYKYIGNNLNHGLTVDELFQIAFKLNCLNSTIENSELEKQQEIQKMLEQEEKDIINFANFAKELLKKQNDEK